jgi:hypothetical protein
MTKLTDAAVGAEATVAALQELMDKFQRGEIACAAVRLYKADGSWEDVAIGGTNAQQATALADLRRLYEQSN